MIVVHHSSRVSGKQPPIHAGCFKAWVALVAEDFLVAQGLHLAEMREIAVLQKRVLQHGDQRRRERHRKAEGHAVRRQSIEDPQQRDVVSVIASNKPGLFEEAVLGVPDERQMRVQDEGQIAAGPTSPLLFAQRSRVIADE